MSGFSGYEFDHGHCTDEEYFRCADCPDHGYGPMVTTEVWAEAMHGDGDEGIDDLCADPEDHAGFFEDTTPALFLCEACIERRLGRPLEDADFFDCPLTHRTRKRSEPRWLAWVRRRASDHTSQEEQSP